MSANRGRVTPSMISKSVHNFLKLFVAVWGSAYLTPKSHWLLHFARTFAKWEILVACFVLERYHRNPKQYATEMKNTSGTAGRNLLKEVLCHTLGRLNLPGALKFTVGLIDPRAPTKSELRLMTDAMGTDLSHVSKFTAIVSRFNAFGSCRKKDVVLICEDAGFRAAQVVLHMEIDNDSLTLVNAWELKSINSAAGYSVWVRTHEPTLIMTSDILDTVPYTLLDDNCAGVLLPCEFR